MTNENSIPEKWYVKGPIKEIGTGNFDTKYWSGRGNLAYYWVKDNVLQYGDVPKGYTQITIDQYKELINKQTDGEKEIIYEAY